jgi:hypothetical protein
LLFLGCLLFLALAEFFFFSSINFLVIQNNSWISYFLFKKKKSNFKN